MDKLDKMMVAERAGSKTIDEYSDRCIASGARDRWLVHARTTPETLGRWINSMTQLDDDEREDLISQHEEAWQALVLWYWHGCKYED